MSEIGLSPKMLVRDIMSSPVVTMDADETSNKAAEIMDQNNLGAVIVQNKIGTPIGIITERDIVKRVVAKNQKPDTKKAKDVMTTPLVTIEPEAIISDAARKMTRLGIRRLGVIYKGNLVGILSSKDILGVMPELLEIMQERSRIEGAAASEEPEETPQSGYCDNCEAYSENLKECNGQNICDECRIELEQEK
ncbi:CBS domain-containing protein [Candidatus Bathycorpusculum sp.]|jgi:CBS domain-containing protein|uniref:CBS domain-containing protein n=1 Tax=Candidatus Bathycorpusculum sp. TaxID=2994959 RepID=UPI00282B7171|nr:CBS domain-containing protein [Candidatus Termitimicrobium sp.]MCL2685514.1 CBS domain-containing protein [Candidatus Termitimicrobium sp.]